jgi:superfamily II DNA or RNA helicase
VISTPFVHPFRAGTGALPDPPTSQTLPVERPSALPFVPRLRLFADHVVVTRMEGLSFEHDEIVAPLGELSFDYGGVRVRASSEDTHDGLVRDRVAELRARAVLERLGAVEVDVVEEVALPPGCDADYVIRPDGDAHSFCQFTAEAVPQLRALGWQVDVDAAYPFRVAQADELCWYADVKPLAKEGGLPDWFSLELGVEVDGRRIDVLPLIVDLLDEAGEDDDLRALDRRFRSTYALSVGDGTHVALDRARLRALLRVVIELYQGVRSRKGVRVEFPAARAAALASLDAAFAAGKTRIAWNDPSAVLARGRAVTARPTEVAPPKGLQAELRPYQVEGVAFLRHLRTERLGGVLADDMGLGKTLQAIAYLCLEKQEGRLAKPALVVAPTSLAFNWAREAQKFAPGLRLVPVHGPQRRAQWANVPGADVVVTTYPVLIRDDERFAEHEFSTVILDEAQAIKNTRTQIFAAIKTLRAEHRVCLTGTPVENHLGETWALFDFLAPGLLGDEIGFKRFYRQPIEEKGDAERMGALRELVAPHILRRVKRDVAKDLPPKTELYRPVELRGKQRELYESIRVAAHADVRKVIRQKGLAASQITILDALTKLRQVCCDPRLVQLDAARQVHGSAKYEALMEMLEAQLASGHRALVFSQFTSMLALIAEGLKERGTRYVVLTGATQNRSRVVDAFESGEADVFLISLKAGGTGLNLVSADTVIHYDPWWNPAAQAQATDRAYRIGQRKPVFVHSLYAAGSVEERVMMLQKKKRWLQSSLLGDAAETGGIGEHEVEQLFAPLED